MEQDMLTKLILDLHSIQAVKFGEFKLKSGITSPIYIDLRVIVSFPDVLQTVAKVMWDLVKGCQFDLLCGVPYTALPIASVISVNNNKPMVMRRKEAKDYGTKKLIEGVYKEGQSVLVVEDLITSGISVFETVEPLKAAGLKVNDVVFLVNREHGGVANLEAKGIRPHYALTITQMLKVLVAKGKVDQKVADNVYAFLKANQLPAPTAAPAAPKPVAIRSEQMSYTERATHCKNKLAAEFLRLMDTKKTNLCVAADVNTKEQLLRIADAVGPYICLLKTHIDIINDFDADTVKQLSALAEKHNFMIFEDRKFADIGNTVFQQYAQGVYRISSWSHITNAHTVPGPGIIDGLKKAGLPANRGLLLLAEMSSKGNLAKDEYTSATVTMAQENRDFVIGFISMRKISDDPSLIHMTPGVGGLEKSAAGDGLGQQYATPQQVLGEKFSDVIIVGRNIIGAQNISETAQQYQHAGWQAYTNRIHPRP